MRLIPLIFVPIVLLFACAMIILVMPLPAPVPPPLSKARNLAAAVTVGVLGMGYLVSLTVYLIAAFLRAGQALDPALTPLGLAPRQYMLAGRQYQGTVEGRPVEVRYTPAQGTSPAILEVFVSADTRTRMALGRQRPLLDCRDCPRVEMDDAELAGVLVFAQEEARARGLLVDRDAKAALVRLLAGQEELYVQPDKVWFRAHPRQVTGDAVRQWLDDTLALARAAEGGK